MSDDNDVLEPDVIEPDDPEAGLTRQILRRPATPVSLSELAALKGEAVEIIEARVQILKTVRLAALRMTLPEDWVLFRAPEEHGGQVVGYLQDCGADRVRDIFGIRVFNVSTPEKVVAGDGTHFMYLVSGRGASSLTRQVVDGIEGGRSSTDDFCKDKTGAALELLVRKAARANLDGNVTRELSGMKSVPLEEITEAWVGTAKKVDRCRRGRGFGTASERLGATSEKAPDVEPPICPHCKSVGKFRPAKGNRAAFYGCPKYDTHPSQKWIVDAAQWVADAAKKAPVATPAPAAAGATNGEAGMADANPFKR
jgi:hypothetical protein